MDEATTRELLHTLLRRLVGSLLARGRRLRGSGRPQPPTEASAVVAYEVDLLRRRLTIYGVRRRSLFLEDGRAAEHLASFARQLQQDAEACDGLARFLVRRTVDGGPLDAPAGPVQGRNLLSPEARLDRRVATAIPIHRVRSVVYDSDPTGLTFELWGGRRLRGQGEVARAAVRAWADAKLAYARRAAEDAALLATAAQRGQVAEAVAASPAPPAAGAVAAPPRATAAEPAPPSSPDRAGPVGTPPGLPAELAGRIAVLSSRPVAGPP